MCFLKVPEAGKGWRGDVHSMSKKARLQIFPKVDGLKGMVVDMGEALPLSVPGARIARRSPGPL